MSEKETPLVYYAIERLRGDGKPYSRALSPKYFSRFACPWSFSPGFVSFFEFGAANEIERIREFVPGMRRRKMRVVRVAVEPIGN